MRRREGRKERKKREREGREGRGREGEGGENILPAALISWKIIFRRLLHSRAAVTTVLIPTTGNKNQIK